MCYNLTADNMGHQKNPAFQDGGQFEIRIAKEQFPIPAPHCKSNLILRMPWTDPALDNAATKVQSKRDLYNKIVSLAASSEQPLEVQLDLSPFVKEVSSEPLGLELTGCNVFFRHEAGAYVSTALSSK
jgi:hypothetical protein